MNASTGPLRGIKAIEIPNIGPIQFAGTMLSDLGAEVLRLDRASEVHGAASAIGASEFAADPHAVLDRGRRSVGVDLKHPDGVAAVLRLVESADVLIEGFRPGVCERLGIGPVECRSRNPRLVYGRMTGWGQDGPMAGDVGHDLNYLALAGVLYHLGPAGGPPHPPINLLADFGGGGMLLANGILAALVERSTSGEGQVVDAAMIDGAAMLMSVFWGLDAMGAWGERGTNLLDGGAPFYAVYETADDAYISIAAFEGKFYATLLGVLGFDDLDPADQMNQEHWPELRERLETTFGARTRDEWVEVFAGHEVCFAPVLSMSEARTHPHNVARGLITDVDGAPHPSPAPRFDRTPGSIAGPPSGPGSDTEDALTDWGFDTDEIASLRASGAIA